MNIQFDGLSTKQFFDWIAKRFIELAMPTIKEALHSEVEGEVLLTRKEICEQTLNCSVDFADKHFLYKSGFPFVMIGSTRRYPKKAVEKWIRENTNYNK